MLKKKIIKGFEPLLQNLQFYTLAIMLYDLNKLI